MERRHRLRGVRNLLAAAVLLAFLWWVRGCPLPTREMELHRYERQNLIDQSAVVFACESGGERMIPGRDPVMLVGVSAHTVQTYSRTHPFNIWPKNEDSATLVVLPSELEYDPLVVGLVAVDPPARAERARLTIDMARYTSGGAETVFTLEGKREGAVFLFRLEEDLALGHPLALDSFFHTTSLPPYTLEFFTGEGVPLGTAANREHGPHPLIAGVFFINRSALS